MAISEELELDISGALAAIESLSEPLTALGENLTISLNTAIESVTVEPLVEQLATLDASGLTTTIDAAVSAADGTVPIDADTDAVPEEINTSIDSADTTVVLEPDTADFGGSIDEALAAADAVVTVDADASSIGAEIEAEVAGADTTVELDVDSAGLEGVTSQVDDVTGSVSGLDATIAGAAGGFSRFGNAGVIGAGIAGAALVKLIGIGTDALATQQRFNQTFGNLADEASRVNLGGLNSDLGELAIKLGSDDEGLQDAASSLFQFGKNANLTSKSSLELTNNAAALAARAVALNPALGEVGDVANVISNAFVRGGKFASKYGLSLNKTEIAARAAENAQKGIGDGVSQASLALAGSQVAAEKYGKTIDETINKGSKNAAIQQRSLNEQLSNFLEEAGKPLVAPFQQLLKDLLPVAKELIPIFSKIAQDLLPVLAQVVADIGPPLATFVALLADLVAKVPPEVIAAIAAAFLAFKGFSIASDAVSKITDIGKGFVDAGKKMGDFFSAGGGFSKFQTQAIVAKDKIVDIGRQFATLATQLAKKIIATIQTKVVTGAAGGAAEAGGQGVLGAIAAKLGITAGAGGLFTATLPVTIGIAALAVILLNQDAIKNSPISATLGDIFYDLGQGIVGDLIRGFTDGINSGFTALGRFLVEFIPNQIITPIKNAFGIGSPSTVFFGIGVDILQGLLNGLISLVGTVFSFFGGLPGQILEAIGPVTGTLFGKGVDLIQGLLTGLVRKGQEVINFVASIPGAIIGAIGNVLSGARSLFGIGVDLIQGLINGLIDKAKDLPQTIIDKVISQIPKGIRDFFKSESPSRLMMEIGRDITSGLAIGIVAQASQVEDAVAEVGKLAIASVPAALPIPGISRLPAVAAALPSVAAAATTAGTSGGFFSDRTAAGGVTIENLIIQTPAKDQTQVGIETAKQLRAESFRAGR